MTTITTVPADLPYVVAYVDAAFDGERQLSKLSLGLTPAGKELRSHMTDGRLIDSS